jgi:hypothetical protein
MEAWCFLPVSAGFLSGSVLTCTAGGLDHISASPSWTGLDLVSHIVTPGLPPRFGNYLEEAVLSFCGSLIRPAFDMQSFCKLPQLLFSPLYTSDMREL